jgi:hypothetical protein
MPRFKASNGRETMHPAGIHRASAMHRAGTLRLGTLDPHRVRIACAEGVPMLVIDRWTGRHARALQVALRMTNEAFAEHLGVAVRTVANWRERPEMVPTLHLQDVLDTALDRSSESVKSRFVAILDTTP